MLEGVLNNLQLCTKIGQAATLGNSVENMGRSGVVTLKFWGEFVFFVRFWYWIDTPRVSM